MPARIDSTSVTRGQVEYTSALLEWTGTDVVTWRLETEAGTVLLEGAGTSRSVSGNPGDQVVWRLRGTDAQSGFETTEIAYVFPSLPSPSGLSVRSTSASSGSGTITLEWDPVQGAGSYEVGRTDSGYAVVSSPSAASAVLTGLSIGREYSYAVRAVLNGRRSPWSTPIHAAAHSGAAAMRTGVEIIEPSSISVWDGSAWTAGEEEQCGGDGSEAGWLYASYGSAALRSLTGVRVVSAEIRIPRTILGQWPVMPVIGVHSTPVPGTGQPGEVSAWITLDELPRAGDAWVSVPSPWIEQMLSDDEVHGIAVGGPMQQPMSVRLAAQDAEQATMSIHIAYEGDAV